MNAFASRLFVLPALASLSLAAAQGSVLPRASVDVRTGPVERIVHLTYDVATERIRTVGESSPNDLAFGSPLCFDNSEPSLPLIMAYVVATPGEDLLNWGRKFCRGSGFLRSFTIAYRTEAEPVSEGGPGAALSIALYSGTEGFGQPGTEIFRRSFTGLPSENTTTLLYLLTIDFTTDPLPLADGGFGWSYLQMDGDTGPLLVVAPKITLATRDAIDYYGPGPARPDNYKGTFNYGGCDPLNYIPCANTFIQLDEIADNEMALSAELNGSGVNPVILHEVLPARLGHVFALAIDASPPPTGVLSTVLLSSHTFAAPVTTRYGEVLIDLGQQVFPALLGEGGYSFLIPADRALVGRRIFFQGAVLPPATPRITLTNSLRVRVGY